MTIGCKPDTANSMIPADLQISGTCGLFKKYLVGLGTINGMPASKIKSAIKTAKKLVLSTALEKCKKNTCESYTIVVKCIETRRTVVKDGIEYKMVSALMAGGKQCTTKKYKCCDLIAADRKRELHKLIK